MIVHFVLTGITPLLMHRDDVEAAGLLEQYRKNPANKSRSVNGDDRFPGWTWCTYAYQDEKGMLCMPCDNVMACLRKAASSVKMAGMTTFKAASQSGMIPCTEFFTFKVNGKQIDFKPFSAMAEKDKPFTDFLPAVKKAGFDILTKRARVGTAKHVRTRPRFSNWSVEGALEIVDDVITEDAVKAIFAQTRKVGLCDWRPGCTTPGKYGCFESRLRFEKTEDD